MAATLRNQAGHWEWQQRPRAQQKMQPILKPFGRIRPIIPQPTERQRVRDQTDAAFVFTRADFVNACALQF